MSISINCSIDLTEEELLFILRRRAGQIIIVSPPEEKAASGNEAPDSVSIPLEPETTTNSPTDYANTPANNAIAPEPPPLPPKPTRRAKTALSTEAPINATPLAPPPPPEPLDEPAMRSLLSKVGAVHPLKVKAITDLLEAHGGARRLSECDPSAWPAIAEAALVALKEHSA